MISIPSRIKEPLHLPPMTMRSNAVWWRRVLPTFAIPKISWYSESTCSKKKKQHAHKKSKIEETKNQHLQRTQNRTHSYLVIARRPPFVLSTSRRCIVPPSSEDVEVCRAFSIEDLPLPLRRPLLLPSTALSRTFDGLS